MLGIRLRPRKIDKRSLGRSDRNANVIGQDLPPPLLWQQAKRERAIGARRRIVPRTQDDEGWAVGRKRPEPENARRGRVRHDDRRLPIAERLEWQAITDKKHPGSEDVEVRRRRRRTHPVHATKRALQHTGAREPKQRCRVHADPRGLRGRDEPSLLRSNRGKLFDDDRHREFVPSRSHSANQMR